MRLRQSHFLSGLVVLVGLLCAPVAKADQAFKGLALAEAIALLEQDGIAVFYSSDTVKPWMRVTAEPDSRLPRQTLTQLLQPFELQVRNGPKNTLLIIPTDQPAQPTNRGSIWGVVRAPGQGPVIPDVEVSLVGNSKRRLTADDGRFSFAGVKPGDYTLHVRHHAFRWEGSEEITVKANQPAVALIELGAPAVARLDRVVVGASQYELLREPGSSHTLLTNTMLEQFPDVGDDPLRAVKRLPGVATGGLSAASNIRGGATDETLIRFDGLRLVNPFHLRDFQSIFSTIDPRIVRTIDVYTGGFPVNYGDRMSGVIDVQSMSPPAPLYHEVGLSFFNTSLLSSGMFAGGDGEWLASARRSNLDVWFDALSNLPGKPRYTDAFAKVSHELGSSMKITGNILLFSDDLRLTDTDIEEVASAEYQDRYLWLRLDHQVGNKLTAATLLARTNLESTRQGTVDKPGDSIGSVFDQRDFAITSLQSDWRWAATDNLLVSFGGEWKNLKGDYRYSDQARYEILFSTPGASTSTVRQHDLQVSPRGSQLGVYASARFQASENWRLEAGVRWDKQTLASGQGDHLSPRVGVRYELTRDTSVRASWGRFHQTQGIDELQVQDGLTAFAPPQRADHTVIGLEHYFAANIDLRIELYDKRMTNLRPRYENLLNTFVLLPELRADRIRIAPESARARGYEIHLSSNALPLGWWVSYARASVDDRVNDMEIPRAWDQTHTITAGILWDGPRWTASLGLSHRTGWPNTAVQPDISGFPTVVAPLRNNQRYSDYRSVDLRVGRRFELPRSTLSLAIEVDNIFGRNNPCCTEFEFEQALGDIDLETRKYFDPIPSISVLWQF